MPLIELTSVSKDYRLGRRRVAALRGVSLAIDRGEMVAVWGPSGSGKTTLGNMIGLLDAASSGRLRFDGQDVAELTDDRLSQIRRERMGYVFQGFHLLPVLSALENVMLPLELQGHPAAEARERARRRLCDLGLAELLASRPHQLSGGEQQRVAIARALVTDPSVVVADEPTANLDTATALSIVTLMRQLNRSEGTTFVVATHDARLLDRVDRRVLLRDGQIAEDARGGAGA